jgi:hypothetical protein
MQATVPSCVPPAPGLSPLETGDTGTRYTIPGPTGPRPTKPRLQSLSPERAAAPVSPPPDWGGEAEEAEEEEAGCGVTQPMDVAPAPASASDWLGEDLPEQKRSRTIHVKCG